MKRKIGVLLGSLVIIVIFLEIPLAMKAQSYYFSRRIETFKADGVTPSTVFNIGETCVIVVEFSWPPYDVIIVDPDGDVTPLTSPGSTFTTSIVLNEIGTWEIQLWKDMCQYVDMKISVLTFFVASEAVSTMIPLTACLAVLGSRLLAKKRSKLREGI